MCRPVPYTSSYVFFVTTTVWPFSVPIPLELMLPLMLLSQPMANSALHGVSFGDDCAWATEPAAKGSATMSPAMIHFMRVRRRKLRASGGRTGRGTDFAPSQLAGTFRRSRARRVGDSGVPPAGRSYRRTANSTAN